MAIAATHGSGPARLPGMDDAGFRRRLGLIVLGPGAVPGCTPASMVRLGGPQTLAFQRT
jgi:hypothetical protein